MNKIIGMSLNKFKLPRLKIVILYAGLQTIFKIPVYWSCCSYAKLFFP